MSYYKELIRQGQYSQVLCHALTQENPGLSSELLGVSGTYIDLLVLYDKGIHFVKRFPLPFSLLRLVAFQTYLVGINDRQDLVLLAYESDNLLVKT